MHFLLVGGAVRDKLLKLPIKDKDWVVVGSTPQNLIEKGFIPVGKDFPVFLHPQTKEEYALARTERKSGVGYTGFTFYTNKSVTIEQDLQRRDLTINAIAQKENGDFIDPYNGIKDLNNRILRHVSNAFCEDPVRVLRIARFAARFHHLGFSIAPTTLQLMKNMTQNGELNHLTPERVWQEMLGALNTQNPHIFFQTLRYCHALKILMPELDALFCYSKTAAIPNLGVQIISQLKQATKQTQKTTIRFASIIHNIKNTTPNNTPTKNANKTNKNETLLSFCERLKVPNDHKELAHITSQFYETYTQTHLLSNTQILDLFKQTDALRRPERFIDFLTCAQAISTSSTNKNESQPNKKEVLKNYLQAVKSVNAKEILLKNPNIKGEQIGEAIRKKQLANIGKQKDGH